jgi:hypothetical protein
MWHKIAPALAERFTVVATDLTGYLCVATAFLGLAWTFRQGELIRVGLGVENLSPAPRRMLELFALTLAAVMVGYIVWWTWHDAMFSLEIEEVAQGSMPYSAVIQPLAPQGGWMGRPGRYRGLPPMPRGQHRSARPTPEREANTGARGKSSPPAIGAAEGIGVEAGLAFIDLNHPLLWRRMRPHAKQP